MSVITRVTTWSDGQTLTASALNGEFNNILSDYNGNITNANISASAGISYSKLNLTSSIVYGDLSAAALASLAAYTRRDITTNTAKTSMDIFAGWDYVAGNGTIANSKSVSFENTFAQPPIVLISMCGVRSIASGAPTVLSDFVNDAALYSPSAQAISTTGFTANITRSDGLNSAFNFGFTWIAIGN